MALYDHAKNVILITVFIYYAPHIVEGIRTQYRPFMEQTTHIGVITLSGTIENSALYTTTINSFFANPHIKGILLTIDACTIPLGTAYALFNEITLLKKEYHKPLVALIENRCSAEGYLVACATDYIITSETACIECNTHVTKQENDSSCISHQEETQQLYIKLIATARKLSLSTQTDWAHATLTGHQARILKLIDMTGSLYNAIAFFKQKALIVGTIKWIEHKTERGFYDRLSHIFFGNQQTVPK